MSLTRHVLKQTRLGHALFVVLAIVGLYVWWHMPVEVFPRLEINRAMVLTVWPGADADEIEWLVTRPIESQVAGVAGIATYRSESTDGLSRLVVELDENADDAAMDRTLAEVRSRLDRLVSLPDGCKRPQLVRLNLNEQPLLRVCLFDEANAGELALRRAALDLQTALGEVEGVSRVNVVGGSGREFRVLLDRPAIEQYDLTVSEVAMLLQRTNLSMPAGGIQVEGEQVSVHSNGAAKTAAELEAAIVRKDPSGAHVRVRDLGRVAEHAAGAGTIVRYKGRPAVVVEVSKTPAADTVAVRDKVAAFLEQYERRDLPSGMRLDVAFDLTPWITGAMDVMEQNLLVGCAMVFLVLGMFLGVRNSILALLGIPFSFLCTLIAMSLLGITLNTASVFVLVLVSGLIVDDAIVVLENIHRHLQSGASRSEAIVRGTDEVLWPICTAALTTLAAFLPIVLVGGMVARFFAVVPTIVGVALLSSLFECLVMLPGHVLDWGPKLRTGPPGRVAQLAGRLVVEPYLALVRRLVRVRYAAAVAFGALAALAAAAFGYLLRKDALPSEFPMAIVSYEIGNDAPLERTDEVGGEIVAALGDLVGERGTIKNSIAISGMQLGDGGELVSKPNVGLIWVQFHPTGGARRNPGKLLADMRGRLDAHRRRHPELDLRSLSVQELGGAQSAMGVSIRVEHDDLAKCRRAALHVRRQLAAIPGVSDIRDNVQVGYFQWNVQAREPQTSEFGLTFFDVATAVRAATAGMPAGTVRDVQHNEDVPVRVLLDEPYRDSLDDLMRETLKSPLGVRPRLDEVAVAGYSQDYAVRGHYNGRRYINVTATVDSRALDEQGRKVDLLYVNRRIRDQLADLKREVPGLNIVVGGRLLEMRETMQRIAAAGGLAVLLVYFILLAQFRDYTKPLLVVTTIAFAAVGMVGGLLLHDYVFSAVTGVALVGLFGVSVNDGIILIDFIQSAPRDPRDPLAHLVAGCRLRLRPILVTTITTVAGLLPMALGVAGYSTIWSPFAAAFCYGLSFATLLTLLLIPCFYAISDDVNRLAARLLGRTGGEVAGNATDSEQPTKQAVPAATNDRSRFTPADAVTGAVLAAIALLSMGAAFGIHRTRAAVLERPALVDSSELAPEVDVLALEPQDLEISFSAHGMLQPLEEVTLHAEVSGDVTAKHIEIGQRVDEGDVLLEIDAGLLEARLEEAKANEKRARLAATEAKNRLERAQQSGNQQNITDAANQKQAADAGLELAEAQIRSARTMYDRRIIKSPIRGTVAEVKVGAGQFVAEGVPVARIVRTERLKVEVPLTTPELLALGEAGDAPACRVQALGRTIDARLVQIAPQADPKSRRTTVELELDNAEGLLRPGIPAEAGFACGVTRNALALPRKALVERGARLVCFRIVKRGGREFAQQVEPQYRAIVDCADRVLLNSGNRAHSADGGDDAEGGSLQPGDRIAIGSLLELEDGIEVVTRPSRH